MLKTIFLSLSLVFPFPALSRLADDDECVLGTHNCNDPNYECHNTKGERFFIKIISFPRVAERKTNLVKLFSKRFSPEVQIALSVEIRSRRETFLARVCASDKNTFEIRSVLKTFFSPIASQAASDAPESRDRRRRQPPQPPQQRLLGLIRAIRRHITQLRPMQTPDLVSLAWPALSETHLELASVREREKLFTLPC